MNLTDLRTRVVKWHGPTIPPQPHFCTNPMDILALTEYKRHEYEKGIIKIKSEPVNPTRHRRKYDNEFKQQAVP